MKQLDSSQDKKTSKRNKNGNEKQSEAMNIENLFDENYKQFIKAVLDEKKKKGLQKKTLMTWAGASILIFGIGSSIHILGAAIISSIIASGGVLSLVSGVSGSVLGPFGMAAAAAAGTGVAIAKFQKDKNTKKLEKRLLDAKSIHKDCKRRKDADGMNQLFDSLVEDKPLPSK